MTFEENQMYPVDASNAFNKPVSFKIFSFFSGCGFLDLGFENNGFKVEFVNEFSPAFMKAYKYSRSKMNIPEPEFGYFNNDVNVFLTTDKGSELQNWIEAARADGSLIGFLGGPPCPDFSVAGKNRGREGDNGKLSMSYINLITKMLPDFFLFENVKGLWKTAKHRAFYDEMKQQIQTAGYATTDKLVNALEFGAPQDRERIFLFGVNQRILGENDIKDFPWEKYKKYSLEEIKAYPWPKAEPFVNEGPRDCPAGIPRELTVEYWFNKNDVANHPNANDYFTPHQGLIRMQSIKEGDVCKKSYKRLHRWRYSPTVAYGNNEVHLHPYKERRISAAEAMSLQTLPKTFELPPDMTLTDKFKTIGNGVPYVLSCGIAQSTYDFLNNIHGGSL